MFAQVQLLNGFHQLLWYSVPESLQHQISLGSIIRVPLKKQSLSGIITQLRATPPHVNFALKPIESMISFPADSSYNIFLDQLARYYQIPKHFFLQRIAHFIEQKKSDTFLQDTAMQENEQKKFLTDEQSRVFEFVAAALDRDEYTPTLLHGVTGSGKTEVYKKLIEVAITQKKTVILLLPEVTLALQFQQIMQHHFNGSCAVAGFHSGSSTQEKKMVWSTLVRHEPMLIIGVHVPVLLPIADLGLIIIDEEHDIGYQEKKHPRINTKHAALMRAQICRIPILLGSATPSISSLYNVQEKKWHFFQLTQRFAGQLPTLKRVILSESKKKRRNFWICQELEDAIADRLSKKEQSIIFINRRGYSFFVQCKGCNEISRCTQCSVSLTVHENQLLMCHYCGFSQQIPQACQQCHTKNFILKGIGTQQAVTILQSLFPQARISRADLDTTKKKNMWQETMRAFSAGELDILVGTQTITKGYDFPGVTLVGILWADLAIHFPKYNAAETALQQLIQVAGRAGRHCKESLVIIQALKEHGLFEYVDEIRYPEFCKNELQERNLVGYPPCFRLAELEIKNNNEQEIDREAHHIVQALKEIRSHLKCDVRILGPAKPPVHTIKKTHIRTIFLKSAQMHAIAALYTNLNKVIYNSHIYFSPNPM